MIVNFVKFVELFLHPTLVTEQSMLTIPCTYLSFVWQQAFFPSQTGLTPNMFNMIQKCKNCQRDL